MKNEKLKILFSAVFLASLLFPSASLAATIYKAGNVNVCYEGLVPCGLGKPHWINGGIVDGKCRGTEVRTGTPCQFCHFFVMADGIIDFVLWKIVLPLAVLFLVIGGAFLLTSAGDPAKISRGQLIITSVVWGLVIIFAAYLLVGTVFKFAGLADWTESFYKNWWTKGVFEFPCQIEL